MVFSIMYSLKNFLVMHGERIMGTHLAQGERMAVQICFGRKTHLSSVMKPLVPVHSPVDSLTLMPV